ncbi:MAG: magnesium/cobalt transporter CorA [Methylococcaceae bacterium]|nr:magnesium/cobalt transporter CorA [Methylococcaceae bacterium]
MKFTYPVWHKHHQQGEQKERYSSADKSGLPPGSLVHIGEVHNINTNVSVIQYNDDSLVHHDDVLFSELGQFNSDNLKTWINVDGLSDTRVVESIGKEFGIHPLVLEDILSTHQRAKLEEYEDYLYLVVKGISINSGDDFKLQYEQISILLLKNHVITFKERADDVFKPIYYRLENSKGRLRKSGSDYLTYAVLDAIVDEYFVVEDGLDGIFESLEDNLLLQPGPEVLHSIQQMRRELISMKRNISPLRELLSTIKRSDTALLKEDTLRYYDDVYDHVLRVTDALESYREMIASLQDVYLSSISNKMNETMKVLTIFASIFIPLTFIAGVYGMNFEYMPELKWRWAYPVLWSVFISTGLGLLVIFKKKKWL